MATPGSVLELFTPVALFRASLLATPMGDHFWRSSPSAPCSALLSERLPRHRKSVLRRCFGSLTGHFRSPRDALFLARELADTVLAGSRIADRNSALGRLPGFDVPMGDARADIESLAMRLRCILRGYEMISPSCSEGSVS